MDALRALAVETDAPVAFLCAVRAYTAVARRAWETDFTASAVAPCALKIEPWQFELFTLV